MNIIHVKMLHFNLEEGNGVSAKFEFTSIKPEFSFELWINIPKETPISEVYSIAIDSFKEQMSTIANLPPSSFHS
ncbi:MAG: hypothetical protein HKN33_13550 [Pyrinomonadaceae bacterium]|nr:hypothetical protein [Pyrinomonadaceae bacterium]